MSFVEWYKEHESLDKESFERELEIYKNDVIANLGMSSDKNAVYIVNAGRMNHGKSSLFNSLLGREEFQAKDVRTTVKNKEVKWKDNIILVDTPGLDAVDEDTSKAYEAYYNADLIFFVHTVRTGELHDSEIEAIKKISKNFTKDYFWKHFCLVLSFKESVDTDSLEKITQESVNAINKACNADEFAVFAISNSRYLKGVAENKKGLINHSGILDLLDYIDTQIDAWYRESIDKNEDVLRDNLLKICKEANSILQEQKNSETINKNVPGGGKSVDELREIVKTFKLEIDDLDKKYWEKQDRWRSVQDKISKLNDRNIAICAWYDKQDEYDRNSREIDRLMAEQEKIDGEQERLENGKYDKEDEAQLTCVKLGILDEELAFSYKLVMDNIDKISSQMKNDGNKLDYVRDFCNELDRISKSDNLLLLVKNGEMSKHLRILGVAAELSGDDDIKKDEVIILSKIQQSDGSVSNDEELQDSLNNAYRRIYNITSDLRGAISREIGKIDKVIAGYMQEADERIQKIHAVIDEDAFWKENGEIKNKMDIAVKNGDFDGFERLNALYGQRSNEYRRLLEERTAMMDKATQYFRKCGVLNEVDKFFNNTIEEYIDKYADGLYEENVNELQEKLRKLTNGLRSVKVIGELVGIKVTE
ncbi:GTPase [Anaerovibrio sp.]|uniref:GTPase n=1 Tax=Anaerovibrio sp. TaxID=1872532 RepID=UPI00388E7653